MTGGPFPYRLPPNRSKQRGKPMLRTYLTTGIALAVGAPAFPRGVAPECDQNRRRPAVHRAPGAEAASVFTDSFAKAGGQVVETIKVPLANPDFAPFLQRARDLNPDTLFVFVPAGQAGTFAKQFTERGLDKAGIKLINIGVI